MFYCDNSYTPIKPLQWLGYIQPYVNIFFMTLLQCEVYSIFTFLPYFQSLPSFSTCIYVMEFCFKAISLCTTYGLHFACKCTLAVTALEESPLV